MGLETSGVVMSYHPAPQLGRTDVGEARKAGASQERKGSAGSGHSRPVPSLANSVAGPRLVILVVVVRSSQRGRRRNERFRQVSLACFSLAAKVTVTMPRCVTVLRSHSSIAQRPLRHLNAGDGESQCVCDHGPPLCSTTSQPTRCTTTPQRRRPLGKAGLAGLLEQNTPDLKQGAGF